MDLIDRKVDEIWDKVFAKSPVLMYDWIKCFSSSYIKGKEISKLKIKKSLTEREYQSDPPQNFICRLMSREHGYRDPSNVCKRRLELAVVFLRFMAEDSYWQDYIVATLGLCSVGEMEHWPESSSRDENVANARYKPSSNELHEAAKLEDEELVEELVKKVDPGSIMQPDEYGYTPLHAAAVAVRPNAKIAKLLVASVRPDERERFLNAKTNSQWGENTALHIAAGNCNVTAAFIEEIKGTDSRQRNSTNDTPYHVAAKLSRNPDVIVYMLNTFAPRNHHWDVDEVEEGRSDDSVINICARNGNAKAVEQLIKNGADISRGVLQEIVIESVRNPEKIGKLLEVYQMIVDNAVTWYCLENGSAPTYMSYDYYVVYRRKIMIWLLTNPSGKHKRDVLQCALDHGASAMFWRIINTKSVFRSDGDEARRLIERDNPDDLENDRKEKWTVFDVTNFTEYTFLNANLREEDTPQGDDEERQHITKGAADAGCNIDEPSTPNEPYITSLLTAFDPWKTSNILRTPPIKELTRPYVKYAQNLCFVLGLGQLIFMILFTACHMPTNCTPLLMFDRSTIFCNISNDHAEPLRVGQQRSWKAVPWLIWPTFVFLLNACITCQRIRHVACASLGADCADRPACGRVCGLNELYRLVLHPCRRLFKTLVRNALMTTFCVTVFVWLCIYFIGETYESYVEVTAMVLLFGWTGNLEIFRAATKKFSNFSFVVSKIITKDIPSFMLYFGFTVVGYTFAIHALRMLSCTPNEFMDETFFSVLSCAFGISDFFQVTMMDTSCARSGSQYLFEFVYFSYICVAMILLLNTLIAMLSHRYDKAYLSAENRWRFRLLSMMIGLGRFKILRCVTEKFIRVSLCTSSNGRNKNNEVSHKFDYGDKNSGSLFFNKKLKRYYLKLVLPVEKAAD